ncbi:hypothetical protein TrRE_jg5334 [Triparma retinervis]|uniref:Enoyl-CoA hydratase n=1 Tax=Triparma retinervis TaxID=2557542 RepID=A0A9W7A181_9STRA|nr:hypothetical protein TrRE_jg5334 [Triparma retinervis]
MSLVKFSLPTACKRVGVITLNTPKTLNALTFDMGSEFSSLIASLNAALTTPPSSIDPNVNATFVDSSTQALKTPVPLPEGTENVNAIILTGSGRAFSAGGSMSFLKSRSAVPSHVNSQVMRNFYASFLCVRTLPVPVIAGINGPAVGAGACLTLAADYRLMSDSSRNMMSFNFTKLGIHPGMGGSHLLPSLIGPGCAAGVMLGAGRYGPLECKEMGLVDRILPEEGFEEDLLKLGEEWAANSPVASRGLVKTMRAQVDLGLDKALWREADQQAICYGRKDWLEGLDAVMEKREPVFDGFWSE